MIKGLDKIYEVYGHIPLGDGGNDIKRPEDCSVCKTIRKETIWYHVCPICGHIIEDTVRTDQKITYGLCWCKALVVQGYIEKQEDFLDFVRQCLLENIGDFETITLTCDQCKVKEDCENGGTNVSDIKRTQGYCRDIVL